MKTCLRLSSLLLLLLFWACGSPYKNLKKEEVSNFSALCFKPQFEKELYRCLVDGKFLFKKFHLSGLLFFKQSEDGTHAVFQNEMGLNFFDFEWNKEGVFKVNKIIPQLDKPALIKTLQKDLQLLLMIHLNEKSEQDFTKSNTFYNRFDLEQGYAYYISNNKKLTNIEVVGKTKVTTITIGDKAQLSSMPKTVLFKHHKANFTIQLHKLDTNVDE